MAEVEEIVYTPEELEEINRIVGVIDEGGRKFSGTVYTPEPTAAAAGEAEPAAEEFEGFEESEGVEEREPAVPSEEYFDGEPEDISLPSGELDSLTAKEAPAEEAPLEDISDLVREVREAPEIPEEPEHLEDLTGEIREVPEKEAPPAAVERGPLSALDELEHLTADEPASLDTHELADEGSFVEQKKPPRAEEAPVVQDIGTVAPLEPMAGDEDLEMPEAVQEETPPAAEPSAAVRIDTGEAEIPDLSDMSFEDHAEIPEARETEVPDIGMADMGAPDTDAKKEPAGEPSLPGLSIDDFDSIQDAGDSGYEEPMLTQPDEKAREKKPPVSRHVEEDLEGIPDLPAMDEEPLVIEKLDEGPKPSRKAGRAPAASGEGIDLSDRDLKRLKKAILLFNPALRQVIKDVVINDLLSVPDTRQLLNMIMSGRSEGDIHRHLEKKLNRTIPLAEERAAPGRRVITARPEYAAGGRERQKRLSRITLIFGLSALATCVLFVAGYWMVYRPYAAKKKIKEGVAIILESGDYLKKPRDYENAEKIFRDVDEHYVPNFVYGYTAYAKAYFDKKQYNYALDKLNKIYAIQYRDRGMSVDIDILNHLGEFYARVPKEYYEGIRPNINKWYYPRSAKKRDEWSQLDVAIELYKRVLLQNKKNITAIFGIGNAYYYQGQFVNARKYYQDIVDLDDDSWMGYAGLLNLYIEKDDFKNVTLYHSLLDGKKMLSDMPSPLLAKLASYYLDKRKTDTVNVRVDYGVISPRFKDSDDNIFPAVYTVLEALNKRDKDYPPLHLQFARLNKAENNLKAMKIHLDKAIALSLKRYNADYFGALHLLGEYYFNAREPVRAYETLNRAIKAAGNVPEFAREDFYRETESPGKSYALLGNLFYYYFDKVRMRYGDLEDQLLDEDTDKMANYQIARDKYEKALEEGYESSEVHYNLGRIYYLNRLYQKALSQWLNLYEDFEGNPELMFALGNAFYHMGNYDAARGEYLKMASSYEYDLDKIKVVNPTRESDIKMISSLASAYNNIGAVYQLQNNEAKSSISYWKAIDYSQQLNAENEFARVNLARAFKKGEPGEPILDESIPYSIDIYREDMRK